MFGGNSNWRGPVWFPLNYLVISVLERYHRFFGDELTIEYPTGSGDSSPSDAIAARPARTGSSRSSSSAPDGRRPCFGGVDRLQNDPAWKDNLVFSEYFHGDNGAGLGASHQTGWTGLIADVIRRRHGEVQLRRRRGPEPWPRAARCDDARRRPAPRRATALPGQPVPAGRDGLSTAGRTSRSRPASPTA